MMHSQQDLALGKLASNRGVTPADHYGTLWRVETKGSRLISLISPKV